MCVAVAGAVLLYDWDPVDVIDVTLDGGKSWINARWLTGSNHCYQYMVSKTKTYIFFRRKNEPSTHPPAGRRKGTLPSRPKFASLLETPPEFVKAGKATRVYWESGNTGQFQVRHPVTDDQ